MKKSYWTIALIVIFFGLLITTFRPVPIPDTESECDVVEGVVTSIFEGGVKDINFRLKGSEQVFYINRGLENGLNLEDLKSKLLNKKVTILYPEYWSLFGSKYSSKHLCVLKFNGKTLYTEID